jgi:hypothetical protein
LKPIDGAEDGARAEKEVGSHCSGWYQRPDQKVCALTGGPESSGGKSKI